MKFIVSLGFFVSDLFIPGVFSFNHPPFIFLQDESIPKQSNRLSQAWFGHVVIVRVCVYVYMCISVYVCGYVNGKIPGAKKSSRIKNKIKKRIKESLMLMSRIHATYDIRTYLKNIRLVVPYVGT